MFTHLILLLLIYNTNSENDYIINTSKCKIPNINPFNEEANTLFKPEKYTSCTNLELLTYVLKNNNTAILKIKEKLIPYYTKDELNCCYSNITRKGTTRYPDTGIRISKCKNFKNNITITSSFIMVKCRSKTELVYENVHSLILPKPTEKSAINVLLVVIDSVSHLNFIRTLPKTREFLLNNNFVDFKGYNKINDNTFPNFMALLTGFNLTQILKTCNPYEFDGLNNCPMIWYDYKKSGYITGFAEDHANISTFAYTGKGFTKPPTDYYFKPYIEASEKLKIRVKDHMPYCTGPESSGERILNLAKDFAVTHKNSPNFGIFWTNTFSHNDLNSPSGMDEKILDFFSDLKKEKLNNTIVFFLSDHGIRFGQIRLTKTGWFEERLPFLLISLPEWFKLKFPAEYVNFLENSNKLTNTYDLYMTLQHILALSDPNYKIKRSEACPKCKSLFKNIPETRGCSDAAIPPEWCTCIGHYQTIPATHNYVDEAIKFILTKVRNLLEAKIPEKCSQFQLETILTSSLSETLDYSKQRYLYITFLTKPKAVFIVTIKFKKNIENSSMFQLIRVDDFRENSKCVQGPMKQLCYCI